MTSWKTSTVSLIDLYSDHRDTRTLNNWQTSVNCVKSGPEFLTSFVVKDLLRICLFFPSFFILNPLTITQLICFEILQLWGSQKMLLLGLPLGVFLFLIKRIFFFISFYFFSS